MSKPILNITKSRLLIAKTFALPLLLSPFAHSGAFVGYAGADIATNGAWRTNSVVKPLDPDGNNIYGTDGWQAGSWAAGASLPAYATVAVNAPNSFDAANLGGVTYLSLDNPVAAGVLETGVHYYGNAVTGNEQDFYTITLTGAADFRIGIITDHTDLAAISPSQLRVRQTAGGSANSGLIATIDRDLDGDYYFFDITGGQAGDTFVVSGVVSTFPDGTPPGAQSNGLGGITFDTITPSQAVIRYAGADIDTQGAWRTSSVVKPLDVDANNIYGTDGWQAGSWAAGVSLPAYATVAVNAPSSFDAANDGATYLSLDNPNGAGVFESGVHYYGSAVTGTEQNFYTITLTQAADFRLGIITDHTDFIPISPSQLRVWQAVGGSANSGLIVTIDRDLDGDYYFFDITGGQAGDTFVVSGVVSTFPEDQPIGARSNGLGGITFDSIPQPNAFAVRIVPNAENPGSYDFTWGETKSGKVYDLVSSIDLSTPPNTWQVWQGQANLAATPPTNTLTNIAGGGNQKRFFVVVEKNAP
jgi:hypothetical protein